MEDTDLVWKPNYTEGQSENLVQQRKKTEKQLTV